MSFFVRSLRKQPAPANGRWMLGRGQLLWVRVLLHCWWFSGRLQLRWRWLANAHMHSGSPDAVASATHAIAAIAIAIATTAIAVATIAIAAAAIAATTIATTAIAAATIATAAATIAAATIAIATAAIAAALAIASTALTNDLVERAILRAQRRRWLGGAPSSLLRHHFRPGTAELVVLRLVVRAGRPVCKGDHRAWNRRERL